MTAPCRSPAAVKDRVVVLFGGVFGQVAADQDVDRVVSSFIESLLPDLCPHARECVRCVSVVDGFVQFMRFVLPTGCGLMSKVTFLIVPVNAKGLRSA